MRLYRFLALGLLAAGVAVVSADSTWSADPKAVKKLEKKKAADAARAAEAKKAADAAAKSKSSAKTDTPTPNAAPLVPKAVGKGRDAPAVAAVIDAHVSAKLAE